MNDDQISSLGRSAMKVAGGAVAALAVKHGILDASTDVSVLTDLLTAFGAAAVALVGFVWSHRAHATK